MAVEADMVAVYGGRDRLTPEQDYGLWLNLNRHAARMSWSVLNALKIYAGKSQVPPLMYEALGFPEEAAKILAWEDNRARADERHLANPAANFRRSNALR